MHYRFHSRAYRVRLFFFCVSVNIISRQHNNSGSVRPAVKICLISLVVLPACELPVFVFRHCGCTDRISFRHTVLFITFTVICIFIKLYIIFLNFYYLQLVCQYSPAAFHSTGFPFGCTNVLSTPTENSPFSLSAPMIRITIPVWASSSFAICSVTSAVNS